MKNCCYIAKPLRLKNLKKQPLKTSIANTERNLTIISLDDLFVVFRTGGWKPKAFYVHKVI